MTGKPTEDDFEAIDNEEIFEKVCNIAKPIVATLINDRRKGVVCERCYSKGVVPTVGYGWTQN